MMTTSEEKRLLEIAAKGEEHYHDWVAEVFHDSCGFFHLEEYELDENEQRQLCVVIPREVVYCWRCGVPAERGSLIPEE